MEEEKNIINYEEEQIEESILEEINTMGKGDDEPDVNE